MKLQPQVFTFPVRVYYEDTDAGGVVYYANYLKFLERCRSEWLRSTGFEQSDLLRDAGIAFVVRSVSLEYLKPARLDELLTVGLEVEKITRSQIFFRQRVWRGGDDGETLARGAVQVVCVKIGADAEPARIVSIPAAMRSQLEALQ
ncbi:MAG: tol-pal system-associated acyl-CoA thioesterase [Candidatus Accumulibacter sp.]|jgi:acyl-CoA thioester hydrolase|nr:tol-pal system-associated acyl-CoA thioesterase [Accumulibacter sp.]